MRNRAISPAATILSVLLLAFAAAPAEAGPVAYSEVVHVMGDLRSGGQTQELRLRSISQEGGAPVSGEVASAGKTTSSSSSKSDSGALISNTAGPQEGQQGNVEVIEEGDVTGTVCDCGEIIIPGGGFPKWLALGGIPLICATGICNPHNECDCCEGDCNPPPPPPIPEPATIFLLGSGLVAVGARARRRYGKPKTDKATQPIREV